MSSREIAELCNKEHKNVIADIRNIIEQIDGLKIQPFNYKDQKGRKFILDLLNKTRDVIVTVSNITYIH